jgi:hypothetical protein|tara:strand:+ start:106 stop:987 length:882 start_codon:yes stop_codon:yes gene_type:complete
MKGISDYITKDGLRVVKVHYSADPDKDVSTTEGKKWMAKALLGYPGGLEGAKWRREMEIDFNAQGGQLVFPQMEEFRERIYIPPFKEMPDNWHLYGGFDYAGRGTTAFVVIAHDRKNDDYYCVYEYYKKNAGYVATCDHIKNYEHYYMLDWMVADPSMWAKTQERSGVTDLVSMAQLFSEQGVHFIKGARGGDTEFAELINEQMWGKMNKKKGAHTNPRYRILQTCNNHWSEMSQWRYSEWANATGQHKNVKESMVDKNNHTIDAAKYVFKMLSSNWMAEKVDSFDIGKHIIN